MTRILMALVATLVFGTAARADFMVFSLPSLTFPTEAAQTVTRAAPLPQVQAPVAPKQ